MNDVLKLSAFEIVAVRSWYDYVAGNVVCYGGFNPQLPLERKLVRKLERHVNEEISFSGTEVEIMSGWMHRAVYGKYGGGHSLFGYELRAFAKLKDAEGVAVRQ